MGQAQKIEEQKEHNVIKAAYLRNALSYAHWPKGTFPDNNANLEIVVAGKEKELALTLQTAFQNLNYRIKERKVKVHHRTNPLQLRELLKAPDNVVHVLFIRFGEKDRFEEWIQTVGDRPILIISDHPHFLDFGGMVSLSLNPRVKKRFLYHIHLPRLKARGIRFENQFLRMKSVANLISK